MFANEYSIGQRPDFLVAQFSRRYMDFVLKKSEYLLVKRGRGQNIGTV